MNIETAASGLDVFTLTMGKHVIGEVGQGNQDSESITTTSHTTCIHKLSSDEQISFFLTLA